MPEPSHLYWNVLERLTSLDEAEAGAFASLVEAAFDGTAAIEAAFGKSVEHKEGSAPQRPTPVETWLTRIEVEGFRGIGPAAAIDLPSGPGLTVIKGKNGTGKSSFAEALEVALTGQLKRIAGRTSDWQGGWRNLHHGTTRVAATLATQGAGVTRIARSWPGDQPLDQGALTVSRGGAPVELGSLGWSDALKTHWPILSYGELGGLLEKGPSQLFDALKGLLGLEELNTVQGRLADARKGRERKVEAVKDEAKVLERDLAALASLEDERATTCRQAISGRKWKLEEISAIIHGVKVDERLNQLEALTHLEVPDEAKVEAAISRLTLAAEARLALAETDAGQRQATAELLAHALKWHEQRHDEPCPLCGQGTLDEGWRERTRAALAAEHEAARGARAAQAELNQAYQQARGLCTTPPGALACLATLEMPTGLASAWQKLASPPPQDQGSRALADHLRTAMAELRAAHTALMGLVRGRLNEVERRWAPLAGRLAAWLDEAETTEAQQAEIKRLKAAEKWLKDVEAELRHERFAPIAEKAQAVWNELRQESSVTLAAIELTGTATQRKVKLDVSVDGTDTTALGVMSQGELNALSLSLFIPRLAHDESPFRFVVVDDPVQAMDPFKVDGLAIVLRDLARTRQVVVLTHDTRLPDALMRMQIRTTVFEVVRKPKSGLEVRLARDPALALLEDARALSKSEPVVGRTVTHEVVPALCRAAFEEALTAMIKRRVLGRGDGHEVLRERLAAAVGTTRLAALAMFDDAELGIDVMPRLAAPKRGYVETYKAIKDGAHDTFTGDVLDLCRATERLIDFVKTVRP